MRYATPAKNDTSQVRTRRGETGTEGKEKANARRQCWASDKYETERLWLHYMWIFIIEFGTVIVYALIFIYLRKQLANIVSAQQSATQVKVSQAARYMVVYPLTYVLLTLPLAAGRMATMTGRNLPIIYYCVAGSMMTSCGWVDALLYTLTRRVLVSNEIDQRKGANGQSSSSGARTGYGQHSQHGGGGGWDIASFDHKGARGLTDRTVTITGGRDARDSNFIDMDALASKSGKVLIGEQRMGRSKQKSSSAGEHSTAHLTRRRSTSTSARDSPTPRGSTDSILAGMGTMGVRAETKVEVTVEPADGFLLSSDSSGSSTPIKGTTTVEVRAGRRSGSPC